ncbi:unnamed protein product [Pedinophyceae sp. YPF-701]|nr:unnamed protein product [Pedinophyceae sp. YPF-701]
MKSSSTGSAAWWRMVSIVLGALLCVSLLGRPASLQLHSRSFASDPHADAHPVASDKGAGDAQGGGLGARETAGEPQSASATSPPEPEPAGLAPPRLDPSKKYAYVYYGTDATYFCAAVVSATRMRELVSPSVDIAILVPTHRAPMFRDVIDRAAEDGFTIIEVPRFVQPSGVHAGYYADAFTKLRVFQLKQYDRVIFLDADSIPMNNPDNLFFLPPAMLAIPRASWQNQISVTTALMVIQPSDVAWERVTMWIADRLGWGNGDYNEMKRVTGDCDTNDSWGAHMLPEDIYDMDLVNMAFRDDMTILGGHELLLDAQIMDEPMWEAGRPGGPNWKFSFRFEASSGMEMLDIVKVVHFTAGGKIWTKGPDHHDLQHPEMKVVWKAWQDAANKAVCHP